MTKNMKIEEILFLTESVDECLKMDLSLPRRENGEEKMLSGMLNAGGDDSLAFGERNVKCSR